MSFKELSIMSDKKGTVLFYPYIPKKSIKILEKRLSTRWIGQGPMVDKFEKKFSQIFLNGKKCVSTGSGTDALHLAYILAGIKKNDEVIKDLSRQIIDLGGKPSLDQSDQKLLIKNLTKQLDTLLVKSILNDKTKNKISDEEIKGIKIRFQNVEGLPPKELRKLVDDGKKELVDGIVVVFASKDDKVGVAVGVTSKLIEKYDAVKFVKISSEIIGGQGGGGRKDFAQAGGQDQSKINEAFEKIKSLI